MFHSARACLLLLSALLSACSSISDRPAIATATSSRPLTLLISIDGFRPAALHHGFTPHLDALADRGVMGTMRPSFPSVTIPNHMTLVTGQTPDHHGIVANNMRDAARPGVTWRITDPTVNTDPFWWNSSNPIWATAEKAGLPTGILFWPGGDVAINGVRPSNWYRFDSAITSRQRVDTVLDWARRSKENRPAFIALYFDRVDRASHINGYGSAEERDAMAEVDAEIGRLIDGLHDMGRAHNLILVSDHGMAPVAPDHLRPVGEVIDPAIMDTITQGPLLDIYPRPGQDAAVARALLDTKRPNIDCWRRSDIPARFHYGTNRRVAPFACMAHVGWSFVQNPRPYTKGEHGYDPDAPEMRALFIASGPAFNPTYRPPEGFPNVNIYGLLARLIGVSPQANDGDPAVLDGLLAQP